MAGAPVKIRVGAALDASLDRTLQSAAQKIAQAERTIQRQKRETTKVADREAKAQLKAQQTLAKATEQLDRQRSRGLYTQFRQQERMAEQAARAQQRATERAHAAERREIDKTTRAAQRAFEAEARARSAADRMAARRSTRERESFARRTSHRATRFLLPEAPIGSMAARALGGVARGAGIDFSTQGAVSRVVELEKRAQDLSNSGYQAGNTGPNGTRVAQSELVAQSRQVSDKTGIDAIEVLGGLEQFQKITGDLNTGRQMLAGMAQLAKATGTSLDDMAAAAANVSNGLGDVPNKAEVIDQVMRTIAGQGKLGAVEISDMATQMARVAAAASAFGGDQADNIAKMGALAQIARAEGGAPSAAEASRSVVGFANTMKKSARINAFKAEGIDVFTDKTKTKIKDPISLIKESLIATGGNLQDMNKMFMDVIGARAVTGIQKTFVGAGGGESGLAAVDEMVDRMIKAQLTQDEVAESAKRAGDTTAAKAVRFQNQLDKVSEGVMAKLVPALEKAAPAILKFAQTIGDVTTWAVDNPKTAIGAAIGAAIARAGIESAFRAGLERVIMSRALGGPGAAVAGLPGAGGTGAAAAGVGAGAGAAGAAAIVSGLLVMDQFSKLNRELGGTDSLNPLADKKGKVGVDSALGTFIDTALNQVSFGALGEQGMHRRVGGAGANIVKGMLGFEDTSKNIVAGDDYDKRFPGAKQKLLETMAAGDAAQPSPMVEQMKSSSAEQIQKLQQQISLSQQMLDQLTAIAAKEPPPGQPPGNRKEQ